jgi:hypothetical protein
MRLTLPVLSFLILFSACSHYQYNTISSSNLRLNDKRELVAENDTMRIVYNFNGRSAPVRISFENKLDVPIFIDWQRSALMVGKNIFNYMPGRASLQAEINNLSLTSNSATTTHTITGSIVLPETMEFIPPRSHTFKTPMYLPGRSIGKLPDSVRHRVRVPSGSKTQKVRMARFTEENSPLKFRSYITYMIGEPATRPVAHEHYFYVSESMITNKNQFYFQDKLYDGNRYFMGSSAGAGMVFGWLVLGGIVVAVIAGGS